MTEDFWTLQEKSEKLALRKVISWKSLSMKLQEKSRGFSGYRAGKSGISEKIRSMKEYLKDFLSEAELARTRKAGKFSGI